MSKTKIGAALWVLCLQYFLAEAVAISGWRGAYSLSRNYISDLGALGCGARAGGGVDAADSLCSPLHALMNASFMLQGALIVCGTALVWARFPKGALSTAALLLIGASGFGVLLVGLAPEDAAPGLHYLGALENFLCCNAGTAAMGVAMLRAPQPARRLGLLTLAAGVVGLLGIALLGLRVYLGLGVGGVERLVAYPFPLWLAGMGGVDTPEERPGGAWRKQRAARRRRMRQSALTDKRTRRAMRWTMAVFYCAAGLVHLAAPDIFLPIVPGWVPAPREVVLLTGVCEIAGAIGLLTSRLRWLAGVMLALYAVCVYPANIKHALDSVHDPSSWWYHGPRLLLQPVIVWWALFAARVVDWPFGGGVASGPP